MESPNLSKQRKLVFYVLTIALVAVFLEGLGWAYVLIKQARKPSLMEDDHFGWVTIPNVNSKREMPPYGIVEYSTLEDGFRVFGDTAGSRKVMVVGDSYTQARVVNDGRTYYQELGRRLDSEVFAFGSGGWGTFQQFMMIDRYVDEIRPDVVVWQMHGNDFYDNSWRLAATAGVSNYMVRPFYENGRAVYRYPHLSPIVRAILPRSVFLQVFSKYLRLLQPRTRWVEIDDPLMLESKYATASILDLAQKRLGSTPVVAFSASQKTGAPVNVALRELAEDAGFMFTTAPLDSVRAAESRGVVVNGRPYDAHWNDTGHQIAGAALADVLAPLLEAGVNSDSASANR